MIQDGRSGRVQVRVHERGGDRAIDGVLRLIEEAAREGALGDVLRNLCREVAGIVPADIASAYLLEPGADELVMHANVGFPAHAVGQIKLRVGEGITGFCAATLRPVSVAVASDDAHYKHVPGIGEEQFPCFVAVPILLAGQCAGVLVLQRRAGDPFERAEVALVTMLATAFAHALDLARARATRVSHPPATGAPARLVGSGLGGGSALGRATTLPGFAVLAELEEDRGALAAEPCAQSVLDAIASIEGDVSRALARLEGLEAGTAGELAHLALMLRDGRFVAQVTAAARELGVARGLERVARDYAFAPFRDRAAGGAWLVDRGAETEDLCVLVAATALGERVPATGSVLLLGERLGALVALVAVAHKVAAIVLGGPVEPSAPGAAVARVAGVPLVAGVTGVFAWSRTGDAVLVDGDAGVVRVSPPASAIARLKHETRPAR